MLFLVIKCNEMLQLDSWWVQCTACDDIGGKNILVHCIVYNVYMFIVYVCIV